MRRAVLTAALLVVLAACGRGEDAGRTIDVGGEAVPVERLAGAHAALCTAADQARGDVMMARTTFYDRSHDALHTVARALEPRDRVLAARLLEAKQRVEAGLDAEPPPPDLAADIARLADVTRRGLAALSVPVPPCD